MLRALWTSLSTGVVTSRYPAERATPPERFRGAPEARAGAEGAPLPAPSRCPSGAIAAAAAGEPPRVVIDLARCLFCGQCAEPDGAVALGHDFELAARRREDLLVPIGAAAPEAEGAALAAEVAGRIRSTLGRSLALRHLDAGSCNACDWELVALLGPAYDARRLGIDFVASPRHADGVIVTGPVTRNLEVAVQRTWEAVPDPRVVIAVGACACSGGIAGTSYASAGGVDQLLPVDVYIPGCPPRPEAILYGILVALGRLTPSAAHTGRPGRHQAL